MDKLIVGVVLQDHEAEEAARQDPQARQEKAADVLEAGEAGSLSGTLVHLQK